MDRYVTSPVSVFTVEEPGQDIASCPPPVKSRSVGCTMLIQVALMLFALLALCGAASQMYYLWRIQDTLNATSQMGNGTFNAQKMGFRSGSRDGPPLPSAHLTGLRVQDTSTNNPLQWETTRGLAFLHDMKYNNGSLLCTKSGLYFVYSKLQLGIQCVFTEEKSSFFSHSVYKRTSGVVTQLMNINEGFCNTQDSLIWKRSSFLSSSFLLEEGDEIYVDMSHKNLIRVQGDTQTFFGLFMLPGQTQIH